MVSIKSKDKATPEAQLEVRRAQFALNTSKYITWIVVISIILTMIMWVFLRQYSQLLALVAIDMLILGGAGLYPVFHRRSQTMTGIYFLLASVVFVILSIPFLLPELMLIIPITYLFTIILGYLFLGDKGGRWLTGVCILAFIVNVVSIKVWPLGWFTPLGEASAWAISVILGTVVLFSIALMVRMIIVRQEEMFCQSQLANLEIKKQATELEAARQEVEKRMTAEQEQNVYLQTTIGRYVDYMSQVAEGNLSARLTVAKNEWETDDPLLVLGHSLNNTVERLGQMIAQIREATVNITVAAAEVLAATTQQVSGANEQSSAISQTSTTIDEVKTIVEQAFAKAEAVAQQAQQSTDISRSGQQAVADTVEGMNQIKEKVAGIAENILALSEQTQQIGEITATVNEIASQSNLLALNASVEAARAGEYGKGFAVVAVEVRNLAEQSKQATAQVKTILNEIQRATNAAVMATEEGTKGVETGVQLTGQTGETIQKLAASITQNANAAQQIVASAQQQTTGIAQIALAMQNINQATVQNLASTRQAEKAANDLDKLARHLTETVEQYHL